MALRALKSESIEEVVFGTLAVGVHKIAAGKKRAKFITEISAIPLGAHAFRTPANNSSLAQVTLQALGVGGSCAV